MISNACSYEWHFALLDVTLRKLLSLALGLVGFALRWIFSFVVFLWFYVFFDGLYFAFSTPPFIQSLEQAISAFAIASVFAFVVATGTSDERILPLAYFLIAAAAFAMAIIWGRICRRRCEPGQGLVLEVLSHLGSNGGFRVHTHRFRQSLMAIEDVRGTVPGEACYRRGGSFRPG
ncbi:MAG: hypothetical protein JSR91_01810 [Proteobacteria bacterium]|nr:hypothetical protein [Pseudomonadota bacterium]